MSRVLVSAALCWLVAAVPASAQVVLTLQETIARAREQAGAVVIARARIAEAEAAVIDASARFRDNPVIEGAAGPRTGSGRRGADVELGVSQQFETGGQRQARIAGARAARRPAASRRAAVSARRRLRGRIGVSRCDRRDGAAPDRRGGGHDRARVAECDGTPLCARRHRRDRRQPRANRCRTVDRRRSSPRART